MQNLVKVYIATGCIFGGGYYLYNFKFGGSKITRQPYYTESIELLKGYKPAVDNLGGKVQVEKFDEKDAFNEISEKNAKLKMLVKGDRKMADFFVYASRTETDRSWNIDKLEIKYRGSPKQYKIFDRSRIVNNSNSTASHESSSSQK